MAVSPQMFGGADSGQRRTVEPFGNLHIGGDAGAGDAAGVNGSASSVLGQRLNGMSIQQVSASRIGNRNFLVTAGAQIPCVLQTAMDSTQPGLTSCVRSEEHTSELQSLMRISYAVFCLKKTKNTRQTRAP